MMRRCGLLLAGFSRGTPRLLGLVGVLCLLGLIPVTAGLLSPDVADGRPASTTAAGAYQYDEGRRDSDRARLISPAAEQRHSGPVHAYDRTSKSARTRRRSEQSVVATKAGAASLDDLSSAAALPARGGQSAAGRAIQKHGDRPGSIYPQVTSPAERSRLGQDIVDDYLTHPQTRERVQRDGTRIFELPDGRGTSFNADGSFRGLREPRP